MHHNPFQNQQNPIMNQPDVQKCFSELPAFVQETIMQSGVEIQSEQHLRELADQIMSGSEPGSNN